MGRSARINPAQGVLQFPEPVIRKSQKKPIHFIILTMLDEQVRMIERKSVSKMDDQDRLRLDRINTLCSQLGHATWKTAEIDGIRHVLDTLMKNTKNKLATQMLRAARLAIFPEDP